MNNNVERYLPILFDKAKQAQQGVIIDSNEIEYLLMMTDFLQSHYRRKKEEIDRQYNQKSNLIDSKMQLVSSFFKVFSEKMKS